MLIFYSTLISLFLARPPALFPQTLFCTQFPHVNQLRSEFCVLLCPFSFHVLVFVLCLSLAVLCHVLCGSFLSMSVVFLTSSQPCLPDVFTPFQLPFSHVISSGYFLFHLVFASIWSDFQFFSVLSCFISVVCLLFY